MKKTILSLALVTTLFVTSQFVSTASATEIKINPPGKFDILIPLEDRNPGTDI